MPVPDMARATTRSFDFCQKARGGWPGQAPGHDEMIVFLGVSDLSCPACFLALLAPNRDREIGGGRATRQPGQVRKEAALTRFGSGRSSVSYLIFERIAHKRER